MSLSCFLSLFIFLLGENFTLLFLILSACLSLFMLCLFSKVIEDIIFATSIHPKKISWIAWYFIFPKSSYLNFIWIFSLLFLIMVSVLLEFYLNRFRLLCINILLVKCFLGFVLSLLITEFMIFFRILSFRCFLPSLAWWSSQIKSSWTHFPFSILIRLSKTSCLS